MRQTLDASGAVLNTASYDPWGTPTSGMIAPFGFTGEVQDDQGIVYLWARWYDLTEARFAARDPFEGFPKQPYSLHYYQYGYSDSLLWTDRSGMYACEENSLNPLQWIDLAGYQGFCARMKSDLLEKDVYFTQARRVDQDALGSLIYLFDNPTLPGGTGEEALKRKRSALTIAQERLEFVFWLTSRGNQAHFAVPFSDIGFDEAFRDSYIHPSSSNQVGHFLTAADLGYNPLSGNDYLSLSCIVGHEQSADDSVNSSFVVNVKQCTQTAYEDVIQFAYAIVADIQVDYEKRDCILVDLVADFSTVLTAM